MPVSHVEVLVEEPSMEMALRILLPRLLGPEGPSFAIHVYNGKAALLRKAPDRLRGYAHWLQPDWRLLVIVDRDDDDCRELKRTLETTATDAGLPTRTSAGDEPWVVVNRIACEELEAWYFGDVPAIQAAYPRVPPTLGRREPYRDPDAIRGGTWEALERVLQHLGYHPGGLDKLQAARDIAPHLELDRNRSRSFQVFRDVVRELGAIES